MLQRENIIPKQLDSIVGDSSLTVSHSSPLALPVRQGCQLVSEGSICRIGKIEFLISIFLIQLPAGTMFF